MSAALTRGWRKGARTIAQVIAGGALTALVSAAVGGMPPATQGLLMGAWVALVAFAQNWAETAGAIPVLLPTPGLFPTEGVATPAVGLVEAAANTRTGEVTGTVTDTAGSVVGEVVGQLGYTPPENEG